MSRLGLDCNHRHGWPDAAELDRLGLRGGIVRTVVHDLDEFDRALDAQAGRAQVCALIEGQTEGIGLDPNNWKTLLAEFTHRFKQSTIRYVEILNEPDIWGIPPEQTASIVTLAAPILQSAGFTPILPGVAGEDWKGYLRNLIARIPNRVRLLCFASLHPYVKSAGGIPPGWESIEAAMAEARSITGLPTVATESGIKVADAGGELMHAAYVRNWCRLWREMPADEYPFGCFFAWHDRVGTASEQGDQGFGLRRLNGSRRPAYDIFAAADKGNPMPQFTFEMGIAAEAARLRAMGIDVGEPTEPERYTADGYRSVQMTTKGYFIYTQSPVNAVQFHPAAGK